MSFSHFKRLFSNAFHIIIFKLITLNNKINNDVTSLETGDVTLVIQRQCQYRHV